MNRLANLIALIGLSALIAVTGLILIEIVLRSGPGLWVRDAWPGLEAALSRMHFDGVSDLYAPLGVIAVAACFPAMAASRSAITVRFATDMLPWRLREGLGLLGDAILLAMFALMAWWLTGYAHDLHSNGETTWVLELPRWPAFALASLCIWITALIQLAIVVRQAGRCAAATQPASLETGASGAE